MCIGLPNKVSLPVLILPIAAVATQFNELDLQHAPHSASVAICLCHFLLAMVFSRTCNNASVRKRQLSIIAFSFLLGVVPMWLSASFWTMVGPLLSVLVVTLLGRPRPIAISGTGCCRSLEFTSMCPVSLLLVRACTCIPLSCIVLCPGGRCTKRWRMSTVHHT